eukprot:TRINITY_DN81139_c0_g1_i1.p1 TRINITY_DN81139_c0_g1~~TRINITY_DN81139_c0_g1_i1.p1  ORF type:complete len:234 (-),score=38.06 TRINITY_DN81139_c0_g1_i1:273-974(-)
MTWGNQWSSGYAPSKPSWDTCWDFSKWKRQDASADGYDTSYASASQWNAWAPQPPMAPPWWGAHGAMPMAPAYTSGPYMPPGQGMLYGERFMQMVQASMTPGPFDTPAGPYAAGASTYGVVNVPQEDDSAPVSKALDKRINERKGEAAGVAAAPVPPPPPPDKEFEGSVKSLSSRHGYGFIACEELRSTYGRDVYLPQDQVPADLNVLDRVKFKIILSNKGHPQASWAEAVKG